MGFVKSYNTTEYSTNSWKARFKCGWVGQFPTVPTSLHTVSILFQKML